MENTISDKIKKEILEDFDNETKITEILDKFKKKYSLSKGKLFKILKENGRHRLDTGISSYRKDLEENAKIYWGKEKVKAPENSLIWLLEPKFGAEMSRKIIEVFAYLKTNPKLKKLLEREFL